MKIHDWKALPDSIQPTPYDGNPQPKMKGGHSFSQRTKLPRSKWNPAHRRIESARSLMSQCSKCGLVRQLANFGQGRGQFGYFKPGPLVAIDVREKDAPEPECRR